MYFLYSGLQNATLLNLFFDVTIKADVLNIYDKIPKSQLD